MLPDHTKILTLRPNLTVSNRTSSLDTCLARPRSAARLRTVSQRLPEAVRTASSAAAAAARSGAAVRWIVTDHLSRRAARIQVGAAVVQGCPVPAAAADDACRPARAQVGSVLGRSRRRTAAAASSRVEPLPPEVTAARRAAKYQHPGLREVTEVGGGGEGGLDTGDWYSS